MSGLGRTVGRDRGDSCTPGVSMYIWCDERDEDGDGIEGSKILGGVERVEITWTLVCR